MHTIEDKLQQGRLKAVDGIRKHIFDWVAAIILVALVASSLGLFGLVDFDTTNFAEFLVSWFPYFAAAILLHTDLYKKGVFVAKGTTKFQRVIENYSKTANSLSGTQIKGLYDFCENYNEEAKQTIQQRILRKEGLSFEDFDVGSKNGECQVKPLKTLSKAELLAKGYSKRQVRSIYEAKRVKVKGINVNVLLSSLAVDDITNIGDDEQSLQMKQIITSTIKYMFTTLALSIVAIENIANWGWLGFILTLFKVAYLFAGCYMSYFRGYDDVTIRLINHFTRKNDILKMYLGLPSDAQDLENNSQ